MDFEVDFWLLAPHGNLQQRQFPVGAQVVAVVGDAQSVGVAAEAIELHAVFPKRTATPKEETRTFLVGAGDQVVAPEGTRLVYVGAVQLFDGMHTTLVFEVVPRLSSRWERQTYELSTAEPNRIVMHEGAKLAGLRVGGAAAGALMLDVLHPVFAAYVRRTFVCVKLGDEWRFSAVDIAYVGTVKMWGDIDIMVVEVID